MRHLFIAISAISFAQSLPLRETTMNVLDFSARKCAGEKISMVTCYDFWSARILNSSDIDTLLVGDSLAMIMHGYDSTVHATVDIMTHIIESGVPVMGHLGLMPQSVQAFAGHKVQGRNKHAADKILDAAKSLEQAGCFALVLECIPADLGKLITQQLSIPTIGIGAGSHTDGQVLVLHDLLGMDDSFKPKFLRHYLCGNASVRSAVNHYHADVHAGLFPSAQETYA